MQVDAMELAGRGEAILRRAMDGAGTLPAKDSVKVRPADWHAMEAFVREAAEALRALQAERDAYRIALTKIDAIRNSIIGFQNVGWSDHIYPLVAALHEAGFEGQGYKEASAEIRTMLAAEAALAEAVAEREVLRAAVEWALGEGDSDFGDNMPEDAKPFWWRTELRRRARTLTDKETSRDAG